MIRVLMIFALALGAHIVLTAPADAQFNPCNPKIEKCK